MQSEVMSFYNLKRTFDYVGYFETEYQTQLFKELKILIRSGRLIAISGIVGCGKTTTLQRLQSELVTEKEIIISRSFVVDREKVNLNTLMTALFCDLTTDKDNKLPSQPEQRERKLASLIQKSRKPVALFVDEAHDLSTKTLVGLKKLIEMARFNNGTLSVVLAGHPKLKNDLRHPRLEEIGARTDVFSLEGIKGQQKQYIHWLLSQCIEEPHIIEDLIEDEALEMLATKLVTPLQIEHYLGLAFEEAYKIGHKPVTAGIIEAVLTAGINDLEPRLIRQGYNTKILANLLNIRTAEVRSFLQGQLPTSRTQDLREQLLKIGIPL